MNTSKIKAGTVRARRKPVSFALAAGLLLSWGWVSAQEAAAKTPDQPKNIGVIQQTRLAFQDKEKQIDELVLKGDKCELKKRFEEAIAHYNDAKKLADSEPQLEQFKSRSDKCSAKIADAYFYWAQDDYDEAVRSAAEQKYDDAINKLRLAIEKYPPCKEKIEKVIEKYTKLKNGAAFKKKVDDLNPTPEDLREKRVLLRQGQVLYDLKQWDKARGLFEEVLVLDPYNVTAIDYIRRINLNLAEAGKQRFGLVRNARNAQSAWEAVAPLINYSDTKQDNEAGETRKTSEYDRLVEKLKTIIIDKISFEDVSVATAFRYLRQCSKEKDPDKVGVNFVLRGKINETTGGEEEAPANQNNNAAAADTEVGTLNMMLDNIPLERVIRYICQQANLKYRIDDNAVVIASKEVSLDDVQLTTKVYPVEKSVIVLQEGQTVQEFLSENGITFDTGASAVYKDYIGRLIMTNTPKQHKALDHFLRESDKNDPQVLIQTKFVEVKLNDLEELGFKFQFSRSNANIGYKYADSNSLMALPGTTTGSGSSSSSSSSSGEATGHSYNVPYITNVYTVDKSNKEWVKYSQTVAANTRFTNTSSSTVYYSEAPLQDSALTYTVGGDGLVRTFTQAGPLSSDTTDGLAAEFSMWNRNGYKLNSKIYALDQADSADVLSCPRVTALHDTTATIKLVTEKYYPHEWDDSSYTLMGNNVPVFIGSKPDLDSATELGITMEVTPIVDPDLEMIHVLMRPLIRKFKGWDDYSYSIPTKLNDNSESVNIPNTMIMPRFEQRTVDTSATCSDNGTIVLGGMIRDEVSVVEDKYPVLGDIPLIGRFFQTKGRNSQKYNLLIFLSCRLVRPDGSPLRERENRGLPPFKY